MIRFKWILKIVFGYLVLVSYTQSRTFDIVISTKTNFSCLNRPAGFYADTTASCKIYHTCDEYGNKFTYHCPEETAFRQDALICDHAHLVQCSGDASFNATNFSCFNEKKNNNSSCIEDSINESQSLSHSFSVTQPSKANDKVRYGFAFSLQQPSVNFTKTENKINAFHPVNSTTNISIERSVNAKPQYTHILNQHYEIGLERKNANISFQSHSFKDQLSEKPRVDQKDYFSQKLSDSLYNFLKAPPNTFPGSIQARGNNIKSYQSTSAPIFSKLSPASHGDYPYFETLKSIQKNTRAPSAADSVIANTAASTTELPVYALTLSLKPLIPSELEYDPYYPKFSTTTEPYYTPAHNGKEWASTGDFAQTTQPTTGFELPSTLPDLNSLEDIVDRRKLLYIPRVKFS